MMNSHQNPLLSSREISLMYLGFLMVYLLGMFIPLMENDSAQHATMAMRMTITNDFFHIYKGENPYLDKPHLHFWLAAISMKFFGINAFVYRIPAVLCLFLAAFSVKKLSELLYENSVFSHISVFIFLSAQTIILSAHDVRTDAVLTGFIIFSIWQWVKFIKKQNSISIILAGFGTAMAFSSKGLMAIVIVGFCIFTYLLYSREWRKFFNLKLILGIFSFIFGILPISYAYYHQFGELGLRFIFFNQSFNRLTANGFEENSSDYFFFFHTLLWVFLPFSLLFYYGVFERSKFFIKHQFKKIADTEFLSLGGFWMVMLLFSASKFKLPHYLNGLISILAIFTAGFILGMVRKNALKTISVFYIIQIVVVSLSFIGIILLVLNFTGVYSVLGFGFCCFVFVLLLLIIFKKENLFKKFILVSLVFAIGVNLFLNTQFYTVLTNYQGGLRLAKFVKSNNINPSKIKMLLGNETWSFDFYTQQNTKRIPEKELKKGDFLIINTEDLKNINRTYKLIKEEIDYPITRLSLNFLNPKTRSKVLSKINIVLIEN